MPARWRSWLVTSTAVPVRAMGPQTFLSAWLSRLACTPAWRWPISPSSSTLGTSAAMESTTTTSKPPQRISNSATWRACSPCSGDHAQGQGGLAGTLWAVDLSDAAPGDATDHKGRVQGQAAGGDHLWGRLGVGLEDDAGAVAAVGLGQRGMKLVSAGWRWCQPNGCGRHEDGLLATGETRRPRRRQVGWVGTAGRLLLPHPRVCCPRRAVPTRVLARLSWLARGGGVMSQVSSHEQAWPLY